MKKYNCLFIILLAISLSNCGGAKKEDNSLFSFETASTNKQYVPEESINLSLSNSSSKEVDSIVFYINDVKIGTTKGLGKLSFAFKDQKLGNQNLKAIVYFEGELAEITEQVELVSSVSPQLLKYTIVNTYPHDVQAYTQGLEFYRDTLYESTGQKGASFLRKYDYKTGKVFKQTDLEAIYFGEGITIINNKIFQLTWQEKTGFVYNVNTFKLQKSFKYDKDIEGWGLTNDGEYIYQSDGSEKIWKMDPNTLKMISYINAYSLSTKVTAVNELEWIDGKIYGNVYQKDAIAVINPKNGAVEGILNLADLKTKIKQTENTDVLNGIAYNPKTKTLFVTGKNWDTLFEIKIIK
jgi:glutamine cyclotransferase